MLYVFEYSITEKVMGHFKLSVFLVCSELYIILQHYVILSTTGLSLGHLVLVWREFGHHLCIVSNDLCPRYSDPHSITGTLGRECPGRV